MVKKTYSLLGCAVVLPALVGILLGCRGREMEYSPLSSVSPVGLPQIAASGNTWPAGRVLYHANPGGIYQIYLVEDGGKPIQLTHTPGSAVEPSWSPNGQVIAFTAYTTDETNLEIYTMRADGTERRKVMDLQPRLNWRPDWSPDGGRLVFQSNRDGNFEIYRVNVDGTSLVNLTNHPANDGDPDWSPDGSAIIFVSDRDGGDGLYKMTPDGSEVMQLLDGSWDCSLPRWSPDGRMIAFTSDWDGTLDVYILDVEEGSVWKVTERPGDNTMAAWVGSEKLLFSGEMGDLSWDLFSIYVDGSGLEQLTYTPESERFPAWAP